ncbi:uncharacterized protein LOC106367957 [Brassica napus]|uniref:Armadillo repeat-containing domain-containing protein n=1 Tax=Brassica oleracea var. oleracea TaxID=109376 RepID=A0A0D3DTL0_BRAOL|nr:PREDICTED: uncharacterized protein LOC106307307 [Brassica oleracea var. oleracea]XP_013663279.1 uncharacterized protein LOC106367957 [Brassica napus]
MRILAARLANHFRRGRNGYPRSRDFSSLTKKEDLTLEEEAERKIGWMLKLFFAGTATYVGYQFFPYMGDTLIQQSVSLLHVKDPLFKRIGASRLSRFAIDDERRMKVVELGGAQELLHMLGAAKDDKTRKEALKALAALSKSDEAANFLGSKGALSIVKSTPDSSEDSDISTYKSNILKKLDDKDLSVSSS